MNRLPYIEDNNIRWPYFWHFLQILSLSYKDGKKEYYEWLLENLKHILPCDECSKHFTEYLDTHGIDCSSQESFLNDILFLHNKVNDRNWEEVWSREKQLDYLSKVYEMPLPPLVIYDDGDN